MWEKEIWNHSKEGDENSKHRCINSPQKAMPERIVNRQGILAGMVQVWYYKHHVLIKPNSWLRFCCCPRPFLDYKNLI